MVTLISFQQLINKLIQINMLYNILLQQMCKKQRKPRPPLMPREGPYTTVNAYTLKPSLEQILTFSLAILILILHSIFNVKAIITIDQPILYIMLALNYFLVVALIYTYYRVTTFDPVDTYIINPQQSQSDKGNRIHYCSLCRSDIHEKSYHCKRCNRCTQDFDHHCTFLNSCIGSRNYQLFLRILLLYILYLFVNLAQSLWVFVAARRDPKVSQASITEWMSIAIIVMCGLQLIATTSLLGFHCYISCCLDLTTIAFIQSETNSHAPSHSGSDQKKGSIQVIDINESPANFQTKSQEQNAIVAI